MNRDDDGNELVVGGPTSFTGESSTPANGGPNSPRERALKPLDISRRDFLKLTSTGVLVLMSVDALADQETARPQTGRQGYPTDVRTPTSTSGPTTASPALSARSSSGRGR